jgi:3-deoxy-7-phosphoheptulonate synthase
LVDDMLNVHRKTALQQPQWEDLDQVRRVGDVLGSRPILVRRRDVQELRRQLAAVAMGQALVLQAGDCAEDPRECTAEHVSRKSAALEIMAGALRLTTGRPVLRVGRLGGQFAKPRSQHTEEVGGVTLPVFRGHMVNGPESNPESRRPDPLRLLTGYMAASDIMEHLGWRGSGVRSAGQPAVWTSHEALLLDYEVPLVRRDAGGGALLGSTHWPWIGERTRQVDGPHVALLADVANPVACKIGPAATPDDVLALCERLDPAREPGRLTLIARMGADLVGDRLPSLVQTVRAAGHPVIWLCDPMHGNTTTTTDGIKTRMVQTLTKEMLGFVDVVHAAGGVVGGLHLETTPDDVMECVDDETDLPRVGDRYTSSCDPRLTVWQAVSLISAWPGKPARTQEEG